MTAAIDNDLKAASATPSVGLVHIDELRLTRDAIEQAGTDAVTNLTNELKQCNDPQPYAGPDKKLADFPQASRERIVTEAKEVIAHKAQLRGSNELSAWIT